MPAPRARRSTGSRPTWSNSSRSSSLPRLPPASVKQLGARDAAVVETQRRIDELTQRMDHVTIGAYIDPPSLAALEVLTADSVDEMSVRQAVLDIRNDEIAADLTELDELPASSGSGAAQEEAVVEAEAAQADAEAALEDVKSAVSQQTQFVAR